MNDCIFAYSEEEEGNNEVDERDPEVFEPQDELATVGSSIATTSAAPVSPLTPLLPHAKETKTAGVRKLIAPLRRFTSGGSGKNRQLTPFKPRQPPR
jgi:hypothetical protein